MIKRPQSRFQLEARCTDWRKKCERLRKENEAFRRNGHVVNVARMKEQAEKVQMLLCGRDIGLKAKGHWFVLYKLIQEM